MVMASARSGRGVGFRGDGVQLLDYRGLLMVALLFITATTFVIEGVHCNITTDAVAPAPTPSTQQSQPIVTFNQDEADALNAVFQMWSKQNPQFSTVLNWSLEQHPCDNLTGALEKTTGNDFQGAWSGVGCTSELQNLTEIPRHYQISVTSLEIRGSNPSCGNSSNYHQCGFDGIIGQLPSEISNLTNLRHLMIWNNPKLTGPVPVEIFKLSYLEYLFLNNNSLSGTLPSDVYNLQWMDLNYNNFSGSLLVSSNGTLFCSSLWNLDVQYNQLNGPLDLQDFNGNEAPYLSFNNNRFGGALSIGSYFEALLARE